MTKQNSAPYIGALAEGALFSVGRILCFQLRHATVRPHESSSTLTDNRGNVLRQFDAFSRTRDSPRYLSIYNSLRPSGASSPAADLFRMLSVINGRKQWLSFGQNSRVEIYDQVNCMFPSRLAIHADKPLDRCFFLARAIGREGCPVKPFGQFSTSRGSSRGFLVELRKPRLQLSRSSVHRDPGRHRGESHFPRVCSSLRKVLQFGESERFATGTALESAC